MTASKNETPEQRERRLERQREANRRHRENLTPEQRERHLKKQREYARARYQNMSQKERDAYIFRQSVRKDSPHRPDGVFPMELALLVRLETLKAGRDPGVTSHLKLTMLELGWEFAWLGRGWFHYEVVPHLAANLSMSWRRKQSVRDSALEIYTQSGYNDAS